jgi:mRNA interferase MazF
MPFEFGDVVLLPFPFTSHAASKKRPAVVVSNARYVATRPDIVAMAHHQPAAPEFRRRRSVDSGMARSRPA